MKTEEKLVRGRVTIPPCRCRHGHGSHTYGEGEKDLRLGVCKDCGCREWSPSWLRKYRR